MTQRKAISAPAGHGAARAGGFTLVELLTVVAIIGLLVGMVVPTIRAIIEGQNRMKLQTRVGTLANGCDIYKMSFTGNKYYPGQEPTQLSWLTSGQYQGAGSAMLARCLFWKPDGNQPYNVNAGEFPVSHAGQYAPDMLKEAGGIQNSIVDFNPEAMAILYYPSRKGSVGNVNQFVINDNSKYVKSNNVALNGATPFTIQTFVQGSSNSQSIVKNDGTYVITAAGASRLYFGTDAVSNFTK